MKGIVIPAALILIGWPLVASAFKEGPYPNVTGGFGEQSCHLCHLDNPVNAPGGSVTLTGLPSSFAAGQTYPITVTISLDGLRRGGFEIAARFASGKQKGKQAGVWKPLDARVQLIPGAVDHVLTFVQHNLAGSRVTYRGCEQLDHRLDGAADSGRARPVQRRRKRLQQRRLAARDYIYVKTVEDHASQVAGALALDPRRR